MTRHKDQKRLIRSRMRKTGESYTSARVAIVADRNGTRAAAAPPKAWAALAGISDARVKEKTGRTWSQWVEVLDRAGASGMSHRDIARHVARTYPDITAWWAQTITVGYERIRGLRDVGQGRDGRYRAGKSRTFPVGVSTLYRMFKEAPRRRKWLPQGITKVRAAIAGKSIRADWHDGTQVNFTFVSKGPAKCTVTVQHDRLTQKAEVARAKSFWDDRLDALAATL